MMYISGQMTGIKDYNYPKFNSVAETLRSKGYDVMNPVELCSEITSGLWTEYITLCLAGIERCKTIYLLKGWENSRGAKLELKKAIELGLEIWTEN